MGLDVKAYQGALRPSEWPNSRSDGASDSEQAEATSSNSQTTPAQSDAAGGAPPSSGGNNNDKGQPMEYVAPPGHGSGCGHCTAQAKWVPKEEAQKAKQEQKDKILQDVWAHEMAHASAGKHLAGAPVVRQRSDGAADGEVPIKIPGVNPQRPEAALADADIIVAAAMAPKDPSSQDYRVAAQGRALKSEAMSAKNKLGSDTGKANPGGKPAPSQSAPPASGGGNPFTGGGKGVSA